MLRARTIMFYDGACPLCRREVEHYRRLDRGGRVQWVDLDRDTSAVQALGIAPADALARLHAVDPDGRVVTGTRAFAAVWDALPYYRWLSWVLRRFGLLGPLDRLYHPFARWRLRRRCRAGQCRGVTGDRETR